ncbi:MAG: hypothetical protein GJ680_07790 [Alteromonadaceae bacterium]|nr:hypothetical protein [Alteromonadaceae bacterium]
MESSITEKEKLVQELVDAASQYDGVLQWRQSGHESYSTAKSHKLVKQVQDIAFKLSDEQVKEIARGYSTPAQWKLGNLRSYEIAKRRKILPSCQSHMTVKKASWSQEAILDDAKTYETYSDWVENAHSYHAAKRRRMLDDVKALFNISSRSLSNDELVKIGKKYSTQSEWKRKDRRTHSQAQRRGLLSSIFSSKATCAPKKKKATRKLWTEEAVLADAAQFDTSSQWKEASPSAYTAAVRKEGLLAKATKGFRKAKRGNQGKNLKYSDEDIFKEASKYQSKKEFRIGSEKHYWAAKNRNLLSQLDQANPQWFE